MAKLTARAQGSDRQADGASNGHRPYRTKVTEPCLNAKSRLYIRTDDFRGRGFGVSAL